jgi:hypothetical protein
LFFGGRRWWIATVATLMWRQCKGSISEWREIEGLARNLHEKLPCVAIKVSLWFVTFKNNRAYPKSIQKHWRPHGRLSSIWLYFLRVLFFPHRLCILYIQVYIIYIYIYKYEIYTQYTIIEDILDSRWLYNNHLEKYTCENIRLLEES